jgi:hypothetical protein
MMQGVSLSPFPPLSLSFEEWVTTASFNNNEQYDRATAVLARSS